ncbi:MAG: response regulator [Betaproteobacteria bacterium]|nr:response regulator [Betaproteobacteria bacterium]
MVSPKPFTVEPLVRRVGRDIFPAETRFLVVDDVDSMRSIVRAMIRDLGYYSIMEAHDATKALSVMQGAHDLGRPIEVVLSDWEMPGMSGLEFLETLRASAAYAHVPFIMITGADQRESIEALSLEIDMQTDWSDWKGGLLFALILLVVVVAWCLFVFGLNAGH